MPPRPKMPPPEIDINEPRQLRTSKSKQKPSAPKRTNVAHTKVTNSQETQQATPETTQPEVDVDGTGVQRVTRSRTMPAPQPTRTKTKTSTAKMNLPKINAPNVSTPEMVQPTAELPGDHQPSKPRGHGKSTDGKNPQAKNTPASGIVDELPRTIPRPQPRPLLAPVSRDSDDNFNIRRVRERARAKSAASSQGSVSSIMPVQHETANHSVESFEGRNHSIEPREDENASKFSDIDTPGVTANINGGERSPSVPTSVAEEDELQFPRILTQVRKQPTPPSSIADGDSAGDGQEDEEVVAAYYYNFPGGGGSYYFGVPPFCGDPIEADHLTEVRNKETHDWGPLPPGHCAPRRTDRDADEAEEAAQQRDREPDLESSPSASDYSEDRREKEKVKARRRSRGLSVSDTAEDESEDDRDFANSAVPEVSQNSTRGRTLNHKSPKRQLTKSRKGKGRETGGAEQMMDVNVDREPKETGKSPRRPSKQEAEEVDAFGARVAAEGEALAKKWNRNTRNTMISAKLGTKLARNGNTYNDYKKLYKPEEPNQSQNLQSWSKSMTKEYNAVMGGLEMDKRKEEIQRIQDESGVALTEGDTRSPITRVKGYVKQFESLATAIDRTDGDIQVVGIVVYTGSDQAAKQATGLFSGSANAQLLINQNKVRVQHVTDIITTKFRSLLIDQEFALDNAFEEDNRKPNDRREGEKEREWYRRVVTSLLIFLYNKFSPKQMQSFPWKLWSAVAYRLQLRLENWADELFPPPGGDFKVEDLKVQDWKMLAVPIISDVGKRLTIVRWNADELKLDKTNHKYAKIPLVTSVSGAVLQRVEGSSDFHKELATAAEMKSTKHGKRRAVDDREIRPLPSRQATSMAVNAPSANPRPRKRTRDESWEPEVANPAHVHMQDGFFTDQHLYTIPQDDKNDTDSYEGGMDYIDNDMGGTHGQRTSGFQHQSEVYFPPRRSQNRAPPSFNDVTQGRCPPPSARSLRRGHSRIPNHSDTRPPPVHNMKAHRPSQVPTQQAVAGPSRLGPEVQPSRNYYRKSGTSLVDAARVRYEGMDWD